MTMIWSCRVRAKPTGDSQPFVPKIGAPARVVIDGGGVQWPALIKGH